MKLGLKFLLVIPIFFSFVYFSYFVHKDIFINFDFDTTVRIQDHISRKFDSLFSTFSVLGSLEMTLLFAIVSLILRRNLGLFILGVGAFVFLHLIELFGKIFVSHPGPPFMFLRTEVPFAFPSFYVQPGFSYPSGHAARAAFISVVLGYFLIRSKRISNFWKLIILGVLVAFDIVMFVSRIYLGEHWATDVIGGGLLGLSFAILTIAFF